MALKPDRNILETDISLVCNDVTSKGLVLCYGTAASGVGNEAAGVVAKMSNPSGYKVAGLTLAGFVDIDQTRFHRNFHKDEQVIGEKAPLLTKGWVITDAIANVSVLPGEKAYLVANGTISNVVSSTGGVVATPEVGAFLTKKDESGFAKVYINLPV